MENQKSPSPHVLIFPFPAQGHVNSMLKLAELLCLSNLKVTFLNSTHNHQRLINNTNILSRFTRYNGFRLEHIPDGLSDDHPRTGPSILDVLVAIESTSKGHLRDILVGKRDEPFGLPVTCFVVDGVFSYSYDVAEEVGVPVVAFRTISASCFWVYHCGTMLIEAGVLPFKDDDDMDELVKVIPGMETSLRRRDLPSFMQIQDVYDYHFQNIINVTQQTRRANSLILNTFEELEGPFISLIRQHCSSTIYPIGPIHAHLNHKLDAQESPSTVTNSANSLWEVDRSCIAWLDQKPAKSVLYVSFGSITLLSREQLLEFWTGLVRSQKLFLWVVRPDSITGAEGDTPTPPELVDGTKERGYLVSWAPQEEVLAHPALGGFLTHSGWNSTLESIFARVPMACWPYIADQQVNSRLVSAEWKIGIKIDHTCEAAMVENVVRDLMETRRDELERSMDPISQASHSSISEGGSSARSLQRLIEDISH